MPAASPRVLLYRALAERLSAHIRKEKLAPHAPFLSHREVEHRFGANNMTVAKAMRHLVETGVLYAIPSKGCFVAPTVKNRKLIFLSDSEHLSGSETDFMQFLVSAQRKVEEEGGPFEIVPLSRTAFRLAAGELKLRQPDLAGILLFRNPDLLPLVLEEADGIPVVFFGGRSRLVESPRLETVHRVLYDESEVGRVAAESFLARGFRNWGVIASSDFVVAESMAKAFRERGEKAGLPVHVLPSRIDAVESLDDEAVKTLRSWLEGKDAVFCTSDDLASTALQIARHAGMKTAFLAVNDSPICRRMVPRLASIRLLSEEAVEACLQALQGEKEKPGEIPAPVRLVERASLERT